MADTDSFARGMQGGIFTGIGLGQATREMERQEDEAERKTRVALLDAALKLEPEDRPGFIREASRFIGVKLPEGIEKNLGLTANTGFLKSMKTLAGQVRQEARGKTLAGMAPEEELGLMGRAGPESFMRQVPIPLEAEATATQVEAAGRTKTGVREAIEGAREYGADPEERLRKAEAISQRFPQADVTVDLPGGTKVKISDQERGPTTLAQLYYRSASKDPKVSAQAKEAIKLKMLDMDPSIIPRSLSAMVGMAALGKVTGNKTFENVGMTAIDMYMKHWGKIKEGEEARIRADAWKEAIAMTNSDIALKGLLKTGDQYRFALQKNFEDNLNIAFKPREPRVNEAGEPEPEAIPSLTLPPTPSAAPGAAPRAPAAAAPAQTGKIARLRAMTNQQLMAIARDPNHADRSFAQDIIAERLKAGTVQFGAGQ